MTTAHEVRTSLNHTHHHFTAPLAGGVLGLHIPTCQPLEGHPSGRVVLDAGAALDRAELWLISLEEWLNQGLAPTLVSPPEATLLNQHLCLVNTKLNCQIQLPCNVLAQIKTPLPQALSSWAWQPVPCQLILEALPLSQTDLAQIEVGALLIMPSSFTPPWEVRLQTIGSPDMLFAAKLQGSMGQLRIQPTGQTAPPLSAEHTTTVRFGLPLTVLPEQLLGLTHNPDKTNPAPLPDTNTLLNSSAVTLYKHGDDGETILAVGQIIALGCGFALRIENTSAVTSATPINT